MSVFKSLLEFLASIKIKNYAEDSTKTRRKGISSNLKESRESCLRKRNLSQVLIVNI